MGSIVDFYKLSVYIDSDWDIIHCHANHSNSNLMCNEAAPKHQISCNLGMYTVPIELEYSKFHKLPQRTEEIKFVVKKPKS